MTRHRGMGMLATIEDGRARLRPMEFSLVDGEWWAAASRRDGRYLDACEGQHVDVLLLDADGWDDHLHGVLQSSTEADDRRLLWELQGEQIARWCRGADDPNLVIMKVIPDAEIRAAGAPRWQARRKAG